MRVFGQYGKTVGLLLSIPDVRSLAETMFDNSSKPFEAVLYHDDIQDGNVLASSLAKQATMVYFLSRLLRSLWSWLPVRVVHRHDMEKTVVDCLPVNSAVVGRQFLDKTCQ